MRFLIFFKILEIFTILSVGSTLKVLIINPAYGRSHLAFMDSISTALVERGHTVHMIVIEIEKESTKKFKSNHANKTILVPSIEDNIYNSAEFGHNPFNSSSGDGVEMTTISMRQTSQDIAYHYNSILRPLEGEHYDIGITQLTGYYPAGLLYLLKVKTFIIATACPMGPHIATLFGIPSPASFVANPYVDIVPMTNRPMSFSERFWNLFTSGYQFYFMDRIAEENREILQSIDSSMPDLKEYARKAALILVNTHPLLDHPRPLSHRVINVGGIEVDRRKRGNVEQSVLQLIENSVDGVVLVSFGSFVKSEYLKGAILDSFLNAFSHFPRTTFLFKFDADDMLLRRVRNQHVNVHLLKWVQQSAILAHPKTKAFISHVGGNSFAETSAIGVPIVAIPLFSDQYYNTAVATAQGTAIYIDKRNVTSSVLVEALQSILQPNSSYHQNAQRLKRELSEYPDNLRERMLSHIEYVAKHGRMPIWDHSGATMNIFEYYSLDILLPLYTTTLCFVGITFFMTCLIGRLIIESLATKSVKGKLNS